MKNVVKVILASSLAMFALASQATPVAPSPIALTGSLHCGSTAINGIAVGDVTGNPGGASDCWGTYDGNDPGPSGAGFSIGATVFDFVAKKDIEKDIGGSLSGSDIGLVVTPGTSSSAGTWSFDSTKFSPNEFLIVLKASNSPGYAAWLFTGLDAQSDAGSWLVAWTNNGGNVPALSHFSVYASPVPVPAAAWLFGSGLIGLVGIARRRA